MGKTTLAASLARALAQQGRSVGLLGIDPARRLRSALGVHELDDQPARVEGVGGHLSAAMLRPDQTLRRWAAESRATTGGAAELLDNPFFSLIADGLAASTDTIAAGRIVEWAERSPELDDLIVDTAPGLPALEFLAKPEKILAMLGGRLLGWLGGRHGSAPRFASGLAHLAGVGALAQVADMVVQMEACLTTFGRRVGVARDWFRAGSTQLIIVAAAERTAECAQLADALRALGLSPACVVLNRTMPAALETALLAPQNDPRVHTQPPRAPDERAFLAWMHTLASQQQRARHELAQMGVKLATAPRATIDTRNGALVEVGSALLAQL